MTMPLQQNEPEQTFWDHLEVLRWTLVRVAVVIVSVTIVMFMVMPYLFDRFIMAPTTNDFFMYRWLEEASGGLFNFTDDFAVQIINIHVASQFFTHVSTSISMALVVSFPYVVYELWRFVKPALFAHELRHVRAVFVGGTLMFYLGCLLAYCLVFPFCFRFLTEYELSASIHNQIDLSSYIGNFTMLILFMGLVFELPLVAWLLSCLGFVDQTFLRKYKSHAVVLLMVLSAVITPSGDPFTMLLIAIPLYLLYELSIWVVRK